MAASTASSSPAPRLRRSLSLRGAAGLAAWAAAFACSAFAAEPSAPAAKTQLTWEQAGPPPTAQICQLKYDKKWAYAVEIDDGPASTYTVVAPLLAGYAFTDAPPGVAGGATKPFVGTAAVMVLRVGAGNETFLSWEQLRDLQARGWGVANHSYWHSGNHWDPKAALDEPALRRELFWSQAILAAELSGGQPTRSRSGVAPLHFVYPNGYIAYQKHLAEYGLLSASRVAGKARPNVRDPKLDWSDVDRNYLDEGVYAKAKDPLVGLPKDPVQGDVVVDFTHGIEGDPKSANHRRWKERLDHIASRYGKAGDDSLWSASTGEIAAYALARRAAQLSVAAGKLQVSLPEGVPGAALTVRISGIKPETKLVAPEGGVLHRRGEDVWFTTPLLGPAGAPAPTPGIERIYKGSVQKVRWEKPVPLAGVRIRQSGEVKRGPAPIRLVDAEGKASVLATVAPAAQWGVWQLYPAVPAAAAPNVLEVDVAADPALQEMEIWAVQPSSSRHPD